VVDHTDPGMFPDRVSDPLREMEDSDCCGVTQELFPCMRKCCDTSSTLTGKSYQRVCSYCSIWTSLPDGRNLDVASIFECRRYGYGKRIKE
jgi:hypothetical protein